MPHAGYRTTGDDAFRAVYGFDLPPEAKRLARDNSALIEKIAGHSLIDALEVWIGAVSSQKIGGDAEAARNAGVGGQPDWDYISHGSLHGTREQAEDLGNFNYGATGYGFGMQTLARAGISESMADSIVRPVIRAGGGAFQFLQDWNWKKLGFRRKIDRTWYGEEVKDVSRIEAGMDYAQFQRLEMAAQKSGVTLDPEHFDCAVEPSLNSELIELQRDLENRARELAKEADERERKARDDAEQKRRDRERLFVPAILP
jgi:hypothetical protein